MLVYLDSSALVKRVIDEPESDALAAVLRAAVDRGDRLACSTLGWIEIARALRSRLDHEDPRTIAELTEVAMSGVDEAGIDAEVASVARRIGPPALRTLDAIHLATAVLLDADEVWAYDERLLAAAEGLGLVTRSAVRDG